MATTLFTIVWLSSASMIIYASLALSVKSAPDRKRIAAEIEQWYADEAERAAAHDYHDNQPSLTIIDR